ncbi:hypothetical protein GC175_28030 [bacterium]|jgi:ABC-type dipeptide/oligopeptide/nickel transport system permease subunit|nr:hypothetical protein [bacterium]
MTDLNVKSEIPEDTFYQSKEFVNELRAVQESEQGTNIGSATDWALIGQRAIENRKHAEAWRSFVQARYELQKARQAYRWDHQVVGWLCVLLQIVYLLTLALIPYLVGTLLTDQQIAGACFPAKSDAEAVIIGLGLERWLGESHQSYPYWVRYWCGNRLLLELQIFRVPVTFFAGGFLGGILWCMYNGIGRVASRRFDHFFAIWYFAHPFVSSILGGAVAYLFFSGAIVVSGYDEVATQAADQVPIALYATIFLTALAAGFSAKYIWQKLDSFVRERLGIAQASEQFHTELGETVKQEAATAS